MVFMELQAIRQKVWRTGTSLNVTIDPVLCQALGISEGDFVWLKLENVEKSGAIKVQTESPPESPIAVTEPAPEKSARIEIRLPYPRTLEGEPSWKKYRLVPISQKIRHLFPGYKIPFEVDSDIGTFDAYVSSAVKSTFTGDKSAGSYLKGSGLTRWFDYHPELKPGDVVVFEIQENTKKYKLSLRPESRSMPTM